MTPLDKQPEPESLQKLKQQMYTMLPNIDIPPLLLEVSLDGIYG
nr:hypothetical protein [Bacillus cereus]